MNIKSISEITKGITNTKTKFFIKGKFRGSVIYINIMSQPTNKPVYFDFKEEAEEHLNKYIYKYGCVQFYPTDPSSLMKHFKIYSRTEPELFWERAGSLKRKPIKF